MADFTELKVIPQITFSNMSKSDQFWTLRDAYDEKAFRECLDHVWELRIEYGSVDICCTRCRSFYSEVNPDYIDDLCFSATLYSLEYKSKALSNDRGTDYDVWLEAI